MLSEKETIIINYNWNFVIIRNNVYSSFYHYLFKYGKESLNKKGGNS